VQLHEKLTELHAGTGAPRAYASLREVLLSPEGPALIAKLAGLAVELSELMEVLPKLVFDFRPHSLAALSEAVRDLREESDSLPDLLPLLSELAETPRDFSNALRRFNLSVEALEAATASNSLDKFYRSDRWLHRFDGRMLDRSIARIAAIEEEWLTSNAQVTRCAIRKQFREHIQLATLSATQLDAEGKAFKKSYSTGRRELEHEFAKSMRFRSIRDLSAGDSGAVVRDLKPIWLMSPLSVSDTLPMSATLFDVVIFDEASQIPVEEAVPALYRAPQVVVVGDEMQLPPTNFFGAAQSEETAEVEVEEDGERVAIALDADSLLTQSARNLSATLLAWHYRSRSESLIGFSNAAFYSGNLYTIPDRALPAAKQPELVVRAAADAAANVDALLARPISYHFMKDSPYTNRRNTGEAAYLAQLVRELLNRSTGLSLGVVAFSEAQQSEIESALARLANEDSKFAARLEAEYEREENDQFCGLFVKNLENVQGDERDIILLSICYGPDAQGRMLMNFGPINQRGGEKRLNVIFSRAKHHMAVISSIRPTAITNEYNDGAAALKNFLNYAECASRGDMAAARQLLANLNPLTRRGLQNPTHDAVVEQLAQALRDRGCKVDTNIGQSRFRCDLAVCAADGRTYALGIIVDTETFYANPDIAELCVTRPGILRAFGWRVMVVLTRDWWHEPEAVLERIDRLLRGELPAVETLQDAELATDAEAEISGASAERSDASTAAASALEGTLVRRLELVAGKSSKFWEIAQTGCTLKIRYGRTGTKGQTLTKEYDNEAKTQNEMEKLVNEKLRKGYVET
jgi:predicted DNA-binding WGR domain protein